MTRLLGVRGRGAALGAGRQASALFEAGNLGLAQIPELATAHGVDLLRLGELPQSLMADVQFFGRDSQRDQPVLHAADSSAYTKSLPRAGLRLPQITGKILGVIQSDSEGGDARDADNRDVWNLGMAARSMPTHKEIDQ